MKIWVSGAGGMLGTHLTKYLTAQNIPFIGNRLDISDQRSVEEFVGRKGITHIINCAAYTKVDKAETDRENAWRANAAGPEILGKLNLPIVHFSTDYVFDGSAKKPYTEDSTPNPLNVYGLTKWEGEKYLSHGCILRTSWLFGLYGPNFVQTMIRLMRERETLMIVDDQRGRPTYAEDLARAAVKMLGRTGVYHFANAEETSWYDFAKKIYEECRALGFPLTVKEIRPISSSQYPTAAVRPAFSTLSTAKIERQLQISPRPWKEALVEYLHATARN